MNKVIFLPALFILAMLLSACQSTQIEGTERATFDGKETSIVASR